MSHPSAYTAVGRLLALLVLVAPATADAAPCGNGAAGFPRWLGLFRQEAAARGISRRTLDGVTYDTRVVRLDRSQRSFKLSFEHFYARRVSNALLAKGRRTISVVADKLNRR